MFNEDTDLSEFNFLSEEQLPIVVLGIIHRGSRPEGYNLKAIREWTKIGHQSAGHGCHHIYIQGTILEPKPDIAHQIKILNDKWLESDCGIFGVSLDELMEYRMDLKTLFEVDCNISHQHFEEAIYPIDCTPDNIKRLTNENIPENLDDFIEFDDKPFSRLAGMINRWSLFILGQNCD